MPNRDFSGLDRDALLQVFGQVGYWSENIKIEENLTAAEMRVLAEQVAHIDYHRRGSLVFIVLSHGGDGHLFGVDCKSCKFDYLIDPIRESECLKDIPKVFLFQACKAPANNIAMTPTRSGDGARPPQPSHLTTDALKHGLSSQCITYPRSDMLIAYSVLPGTPYGSMFIQAFAEVMRRHGRRHEATLMLARANRIMWEMFVNRRPIESWACPVVISQLGKKFFFA
ncbi:caspase-3-like isoform X2 [Watersipora subatra]